MDKMTLSINDQLVRPVDVGSIGAGLGEDALRQAAGDDIRSHPGLNRVVIQAVFSREFKAIVNSSTSPSTKASQTGIGPSSTSC